MGYVGKTKKKNLSFQGKLDCHVDYPNICFLLLNLMLLIVVHLCSYMFCTLQTSWLGCFFVELPPSLLAFSISFLCLVSVFITQFLYHHPIIYFQQYMIKDDYKSSYKPSKQLYSILMLPFCFMYVVCAQRWVIILQKSILQVYANLASCL